MPKSVIIVDDSAFVINMLTKFFNETMQFNVLCATSNGLEAIGVYRNLKPDLITLDVAMPILNGLEVIEEIIREFPAAKIPVVSAVRGDLLMDCVKAGAANFIKKPLTFANPVFVRNFVKVVNQLVP
jgi:two-component system chemotaxis response regulator CheY